MATPARNSVPTTREIGGGLGSTFDVAPWDYYERLRAMSPIVFDEEQGLWLVTSYDLIKQIWLADQVVWQPPFVYDAADPPLGMTEDEWIEFIGPGRRALSLQTGEEYD